ncbi:MAG: iron uptake porin [Coleofasciculaceae cyanobacterium SM2_1_6]|nr:iron uptake porin [Coleofasciculaceae cyanobacterium SM2_1_6]
MYMTNNFWKLAKVSPVILGASLFLASGASAVETNLGESEVNPLVTGEVSTTPLAFSVPAPSQIVASTPAPSANLALSADEVNVSDLVNPGVAASEPVTDANGQALQQIENYNNEVETMGQVTNISQLRDVSPRAWAFEALRNLVERYQCIQGYPDGTFQGDRALTRFEFAAGLNSCLRRIEALLAGTGGGTTVTPADLEAIRRLTTEFRAELAALGARVTALDGRVTTLEGRQFSTTTKLRGEAIFALADTFGDRAFANGATPPSTNRPGQNTNLIFADRVRLNLNTSFTGRDQLLTRLQARNITSFSSSVTGTNMTTLNFSGSGNNEINLAILQYRFPIGAGNVYISTEGNALDDGGINLSPIDSSGSGAISRFGAYNPIYRLPSGAGITIDYPIVPQVRLTAGYLVPTGSGGANDPASPGGLFNNQYSAYGQLTFTPIPQGQIAFTYANSYLGTSGAVSGSTGSTNANRPYGSSRTSANAYGIQARYNFSPNFILSGWVGYTNAINEGSVFKEKTEIWNYAVQATFPDLGARGNLLGIVAGVPPRAGFIRNSRNRDFDTSIHLEAFYRIRVSDNIAITPGVLAVFDPEHNKNNGTVYVGTIRTTFSF